MKLPQTSNVKVTVTKTPDSRPAIAYDTAIEVKAIMQALRAYRVYEITDETEKEFIRNLEDEHEKVLDMFTEKEA